ncbi:MAG: dihydrofolate reductase [Patescibacteria group bacterium]|nr:dihydrofolate reductase [Patescibacteria group bacterium]
MIPVTLMMAITIDGKIAKHKDHLANWTSPEDKKLFVELSKKHGVVIMGENTFKTFPSPLKNRLNVVFSYEKNLTETEGVKWVSGKASQVLQNLAQEGYKSALLGGGATINSLFLKEKLVSEIVLTIEPKIFGNGLSLFNQDFNIDLTLKEVRKLNNNTIMLRYRVNY